MKKMIKISCILLVMIMIFSLTTPVWAADDWRKDMDTETETITQDDNVKDGFIEWTPQAYDKSTASDKVGGTVNVVLAVVQVVGVSSAVIMLLVLGIKYISAAPSDRAEIKKHAVVYVVGAVVLFAAAGILEIIKTFAETNIG